MVRTERVVDRVLTGTAIHYVSRIIAYGGYVIVAPTRIDVVDAAAGVDIVRAPVAAYGVGLRGPREGVGAVIAVDGISKRYPARATSSVTRAVTTTAWIILRT